MKVLGINGSPRKAGNTTILINTIFEELENNGIQTELICLADLKIEPCKLCVGKSCMACREKQSCVFTNDDFGMLAEKVSEADGLIFGSPTYGANITNEMNTFLGRLGLVSIWNPQLLRHKPGAAITAVRRGGSMPVVDTLNHFMLYREMFIVGSTYWNMVYGGDIGAVEKDEEGMANMRNIGQNMAWFLKKVQP